MEAALETMPGKRQNQEPKESEEARQRREESQRSLERGGLPLNAIARLQEQAARQGTPRHLFTSDLSANELTLVRQAGYEALGQVLGSTAYAVGTQWRTPNWRDSDRGRACSYEMEVLTQAFDNARRLALGRLRQEAALLGATGVVGMRLERREYAWDQPLLELVAIGTAIRETGASPARPPDGASKRELFLSHLSGQDFWALRQAGYRPAGLVVGYCVYAHIPSWEMQKVTYRPWNQELTEYTEALYQTRTLAMQRMEDEARAVKAEGVVGVQTEIKAEPVLADSNQANSIRMLYHFTAIGTAISRDAGGAPADPTRPVLWLRRPSPVPFPEDPSHAGHP